MMRLRQRVHFKVQALTPKQFRWLMEGLTIAPSRTVKEVSPEHVA